MDLYWRLQHFPVLITRCNNNCVAKWGKWACCYRVMYLEMLQISETSVYICLLLFNCLNVNEDLKCKLKWVEPSFQNNTSVQKSPIGVSTGLSYGDRQSIWFTTFACSSNHSLVPLGLWPLSSYKRALNTGRKSFIIGWRWSVSIRFTSF